MYILYIMLDKLILKYKGNFKVPIIVNNLMKKRNVIMGLDQQILHYHKATSPKTARYWDRD